MFKKKHRQKINKIIFKKSSKCPQRHDTYQNLETLLPTQTDKWAFWIVEALLVLQEGSKLKKLKFKKKLLILKMILVKGSVTISMSRLGTVYKIRLSF